MSKLEDGIRHFVENNLRVSVDRDFGPYDSGSYTVKLESFQENGEWKTLSEDYFEVDVND